ncbi:hypothetical protein DXG01_003911 [Tephrocybe rancida]|nr:hypothetical protein DXG01_003911 [Tephrocybe rancida]
MSNLAIGAGALLGYFVVHRLWIWPFLLSPLRTVPGPPLGHLLFGQSPVIIRSESGIPQREWVKQYGPVIRIVGPVGIERLIFMKPDALHHILIKHWLEYPRPSFLRNILGFVTGHGLLTVTGDEHRHMRKAINPAFSIPNLMAQTDMYYDSINGLVTILKSAIEGEKCPGNGKVFLMYEWMSKVTLDIICQTAFGYEADSLHDPHNELAEAYEQLVNLQSGTNLAKIVLLMSIPGAAKVFGSKWAYDHRHWFQKVKFFGAVSEMIDSMYRIKRVSSSMLRQKMEDSAVAASDTDAKRDIMSLLVRARKADLDKDKGVYAMSDRAMMDQVLTFLGAGHETTATGLSWTLWLLANDQESQKRLRSEVAPLFADSPRPDYRTLKDLQWLDCVIMESLRLLPPVPLTVRTTTRDDYVDGILVPKGTLLTIPIRIINTWKVLWGDDAEDFKPERWLNLPEDYHPVFSMLSFLAGPHACIGKTMAIIEMKAVLAALIANFEFEPSFVGQTIKPAAAITMKPTDGMPLRVRRVVGSYSLFPAIINGEAGIPQREWVKKHGPVVRAVGPLGVERLIFMKPEALHKILVSDWVDYPRPGFMRSTLGLTAGWGLLTVTGNEHKQMRKSMNPAFSIPNLMAQMDMYYEPIETFVEVHREIESLIQLLGSKVDAAESTADGSTLLMYDWMSKVTLDIICKTAFGYETNSLQDPHNELAEAYERLINTQSGPNLARFIAMLVIPGVPRILGSKWAYNHRHWFSLVKDLEQLTVLLESMHQIKKISATILAERMRDSAVAVSDSEAKRDVMSLLVRARKAELKDKGAYAMSDKDMMEQVLTFLGAGHETTASGLAWTLWLLANDKDSQTRLRDEITPLLADNPRPDYRSLKELQWLDCVVMESLRVLPPVPMTFRSANKTDYIDGVLVPKGTILYIPIRVINTWKQLWGEDAEKYELLAHLDLDVTRPWQQL